MYGSEGTVFLKDYSDGRTGCVGKEIGVEAVAENSPWGPGQKDDRGQRWTFHRGNH